MLKHLLVELLMVPVHSLLWMIDELLYHDYYEKKVKAPIFIVSQPRSGTTFLLRTLSEDKNSFLSLKHLEWRYPYICFWKMVDLLGLRHWLETKSYWPNTELGRVCERIHHHNLGVYEELGIFMEERFYQHYFSFRRFPFPKLLETYTQYDRNDKRSLQMAKTIRRIMQKMMLYRSSDGVFLAKENEAIEFFDIIKDVFPDARFIFMVREPDAMLKSYQTMSLTCTEVKHGWDPESIDGWQSVNMDFRKSECEKYLRFYDITKETHPSTLITYRQFTQDILGTSVRIYDNLGLSMSPEFKTYLVQKQDEQKVRNKGYQNVDVDVDGFEFYGSFVTNAQITPHSTETGSHTQYNAGDKA